jgi:hypothetical protein
MPFLDSSGLMIIHPDVFSVGGVNRILEINYSWRLDET